MIILKRKLHCNSPNEFPVNSIFCASDDPMYLYLKSSSNTVVSLTTGVKSSPVDFNGSYVRVVITSVNVEEI